MAENIQDHEDRQSALYESARLCCNGRITADEVVKYAGDFTTFLKGETPDPTPSS